jgi:peptide/nickel transport system permease protein
VVGGDDSSALLRVEHLSVAFDAPGGSVRVLEDVSFDVRAGETVGIVGESGCGKTMTAAAILGLLPDSGHLEAGRIVFAGTDLAGLAESRKARIRGKEIGFISQEPMIALTPTLRVGRQIAQGVRQHHRVSRKAARARAVELLRQVHLPEPEIVASRYPHELSGGMAQRVSIARALAGEPRLLIADEPTTALDVTVQAEILDLLRELKDTRGLAILLVTHDWGVVADSCDRALVMYSGEVVERADIQPLFIQPLHPYTQALLASSPSEAPRLRPLAAIPGLVPKPGAWPEGCRFHPRCAYATADCLQHIALEPNTPEREVRCIRVEELTAA